MSKYCPGGDYKRKGPRRRSGRGFLEILTVWHCYCPNTRPRAPFGPISIGRWVSPKFPQSGPPALSQSRRSRANSLNRVKLSDTDVYIAADALPGVVILSSALFPLKRRNSTVQPAYHRAQWGKTAELQKGCRGETCKKQWYNQGRTWFCFATMKRVRVSHFTAQFRTPINWSS